MKTKVRITHYMVSKEKIVETLLSISDNDTAVIVEEHNPDDHIHAYIDTIVSIPTLRTRLRQIAEVGNKGYSIGTAHHDWDVYIGYLFKHEDTTVLYQPEGFEVQYYKDKYANHQKEDKKYEETDKIVRYVESVKHDEPRDIARAICDYYSKNNKPFHKANMAMLVNMIWYKYGNEDCFLNNLLRETGIEGEVEYDKDYKIMIQDRELGELRSKNTMLTIHNNALRENQK